MVDWEPAHAQTKHQDNSTSGSGGRASNRTIFPEISARGSLLRAKVQGGRDKSAPRPYETDPIHPLCSSHSSYQFIYIYIYIYIFNS